MRSAALLPALLLGLTGWWAAAPSAGAATVSDGQCSTATGVTVVLDHQELGGGIVAKCVEGAPEGASGLEVIRLAGFTVEGTVHDGLSFVCRIGGRPGPTEDIELATDPRYRETCVDTPPSEAFWAYFHADNGGPWVFSSLGAGNREAVPGGYEGYSFSLNAADGANPPPGLDPAHEVTGAAASADADSTGAVPSEGPATADGPPAGTYVGLAAVSALALGGGAVWWRRRGQ